MIPLMPGSHARRPLFIVIEPTGALAQEPAVRIAWACNAEAGVSADLAAAAERITALAGAHAIFLADPLFDAPRLRAALAAARSAPTAEMYDWLAAFAPFRQARHLAALSEAAAASADPNNPAARLFETWRLAKARANQK
jgi:hypothetical protein